MYTPVELNAAEKRMWIETRSALLWTCPAFTHILFCMLNEDRGELAALFTKDIDVAATDGETLILNPETFFKYVLGERVFITAHEIMHCILNHCIMSRPWSLTGKVRFADGSSLPYDQKMMNIAMDLVINDILVQSRVGTLPKDGWHDTNIGGASDSFLDVYKRVYNDQKQRGGNSVKSKGGGGGNGNGNGKSGFDKILPQGQAKGKDPAKAAQGRSQAAWDAAIAGAIASAKLQGKLPAALERLLGEVLEPTVSWQEHIRALFARKVGNSSYDWRKPDKRLIQRDIFSPARSGHGCGEVIIAVDTSGSIGQRELDTFFGEMRGILEDLKPTMVYIVWCDAKVHKVDEIDDASQVGGLKAVGGGGTSFKPVFNWVEEEGMRPDALVYFTDMLGDFPGKDPGYPVIWGDIYGRVKPPFGDVVHITLRDKKAA
jgi:predicted metal-dependent peptidase